jgi:hypothetical protein
MFEWQIALALEFILIIADLALFLRASNVEAGPRSFVKVAAAVIIVLGVLLAGYTAVRAVLFELEGGEEREGSTFFLIFTKDKEEPEPEPVRRIIPKAPAKATALKEPLPEWEGDLQKKKWHERGEMMKKKWAERGK